MKLNNKTLTKLAELLNQTGPEQRIAVYYGVAMVIATYIKDSGYNGNLTLKIKTTVNTICELAIVDRTLLTNITNNLFNLFNQNGADRDTVHLEAKTFEEVLLLDKYIGTGNLDIVNKNFNLFKSARTLTKIVLKEYILNEG